MQCIFALIFFLGMIVAATSTYSVALLVSGATVAIGALLYQVILFHERAKLRKLTAKEGEDATKGNLGFLIFSKSEKTDSDSTGPLFTL